ncbi:hypothetical protein AVEN_41206-1 [Araneus ventricosus]|uniref:Uncharacterized protein n=1 Tax=Araneus ventricosus TaxID=182803 RepID=A0A4Y2LVN2_ARAVE|nr:hypothetical protein AVEN_41206-1 [Araneus ventricosus]
MAKVDFSGIIYLPKAHGICRQGRVPESIVALTPCIRSKLLQQYKIQRQRVTFSRSSLFNDVIYRFKSLNSFSKMLTHKSMNDMEKNLQASCNSEYLSHFRLRIWLKVRK